MDSSSRRTTTHIFTDGSVGQERDSAGAEIYTINHDAYCSMNIGAQQCKQLYALKETKNYAIENNLQDVIIHTDSKSSHQALLSSQNRDNIQLITEILHIRKAHNLGLSVTLNWIPSHIGIDGNEKADSLAKSNTALPVVQIRILPSFSQIKEQIKKKILLIIKSRHRA
ncbi:uncharacterized protein [Procambarus clarkii]|uniref:uncharacterized protein n=1 Tax=Procambarus clarkii TaxID=6728 RepID=UPI00374454AF